MKKRQRNLFSQLLDRIRAGENVDTESAALIQELTAKAEAKLASGNKEHHRQLMGSVYCVTRSIEDAKRFYLYSMTEKGQREKQERETCWQQIDAERETEHKEREKKMKKEHLHNVKKMMGGITSDKAEAIVKLLNEMIKELD